MGELAALLPLRKIAFDVDESGSTKKQKNKTKNKKQKTKKKKQKKKKKTLTRIHASHSIKTPSLGPTSS